MPKTRYAIVDRLLEQLPRDRILGVILNRAESGPDEVALYYQQRYQQTAIEADEETTTVAEEAQQLEMIYIEEDMVS